MNDFRRWMLICEAPLEPWEGHDEDDYDFDNPWQPEHGITNFARGKFTCGRCMFMALALHDLSGWPIYAEMSTAEADKIVHAFVVNPQGKAVDVNGVHPTNVAKTQLSARSAGTIVPVNAEALRSKYVGDDVGPVEEAKRLIKTAPTHFGIDPRTLDARPTGGQDRR